MSSLIFTLEMDVAQPADIVTTHGKPVLRQYVDPSYPELFKIAKILKRYPHQNIIDVYDVTDEYIDFEILRDIPMVDGTQASYETGEWIASWKETIAQLGKEKFSFTLLGAKYHLQCLGIHYNSWHPASCGIGTNGLLKLSDFESAFHLEHSGAGSMVDFQEDNRLFQRMVLEYCT